MIESISNYGINNFVNVGTTRRSFVQLIGLWVMNIMSKLAASGANIEEINTNLSKS